MSATAFERDANWRRIARLVRRIYRATDGFPPEEKAGLTATIRRAAIAMPARIAQGFDTDDPADALRTVQASLREIQSGFAMAAQLGFSSSFALWRIRRRIGRAIRRLNRQFARHTKPASPPVPLQPTMSFRYRRAA